MLTLMRARHLDSQGQRQIELGVIENWKAAGRMKKKKNYLRSFAVKSRKELGILFVGLLGIQKSFLFVFQLFVVPSKEGEALQNHQ